MLTFLFENPGSTAQDISEHLFDDRSISQVRIRYRYASAGVPSFSLRTQWQAKQYVLNHMMKSEWYKDIQILDERVQPLSKICRGKFAYLTSPYNSRTLADDQAGAHTHPGSANRTGQRQWFYRRKDGKNIYRYFLTLKGLASLKEHGSM